MPFGGATEAPQDSALSWRMAALASSVVEGLGSGSVPTTHNGEERAGGERDASAGSPVWRWTNVETSPETRHTLPCQRSLHATAVFEDKMLVFGGYDGSNRVNDFYMFCFTTKDWRMIPPAGRLPSPRDRHVAVVHENSFYVFAGFDGSSRTNDFHEYDFDLERWEPVVVIGGPTPSPRHSMAAVVYNGSMYVFGGYDGSYRSDFHAFNFSSGRWGQVMSTGRVPRARYRATCLVHERQLFCFGGHDGTRHLNDVHSYSFEERAWTTLATDGPLPISRDSHVAVAHGESMFIFGGSTGSAMNDFHELRLDTLKWSPVQIRGPPPGQRFCHTAVMHKDSMFVFGGYDGAARLNDFISFRFGPDQLACDVPTSTLIDDLRQLVNSETLSDITFLVEGKPVHAHKIMCIRCEYFRAMLTGEMREAREKEIVLQDVRYQVFLSLLEYLYTDQIDIRVEEAMELFQAADRFGVERLKRMCENAMLSSINIDNAASILLAADLYDATSLREKCLLFIISNFDAVIKTQSFEDLGRTNVDLMFEIFQKR
uniref:BTB domain-containing protein n=1 Tax=Rhizochromulina marina TaxID=1034831 RepID=A0A7S2SJA3_9STRA